MRPIALRACTVDPHRGEAVRVDGRIERLSPRELDLLLYLTAHPDRTVGRDELLTEVWRYAPSVVSRAVDTTVRRLREKIEADPQHPDHLLTAFGEGYRFLARSDGLELADLPEDDPFVGRGEEVRRLGTALARPGTTVLVVGPPGAGKTRLARHLAHRVAPNLRGGALLVDLSDARDRSEGALAVASGLGIEVAGTGASVLERAAEALRARGPCLVVLDNCEGVGAAAGEIVATLRAAPAARFLATSRQELPGADDSVQLGALDRDDAVALFEALARRVRPDFLLDPVRAVIEELVERLERLPLAIALAAARIHALSPRSILDRLDDRFRVLATRGGADLRHPTLRAALDGSWELMGEAERAALLACSAFRGGFDRAAAAAVIGPDSDAILDRLCARSLLEPRGSRIGGYAFVREYASERLAADPEAEDRAFRRHAEWFAAIRPDEVPRIVADQANLVAASERASERGWSDLAGPATIAALEAISRRGPYEVGARLAEGALELADLGPAPRIKLGIRLAILQQWTGAGDPLETHRRTDRWARDLGDPVLLAEAIRCGAVLARFRGDPLGALGDIERALAIARSAGSGAAVSTLLCTLGTTLRLVDRTDEARACWEEVAASPDSPPDHVANARGNLALLERRAGRFDRARTLYEQVVATKVAEGDRHGEAVGRVGLGNLEVDLGRWTEALAQYERARALAAELGTGELEARICGNVALALRGTGDVDGARARFEEAADRFDRLGEAVEAATARGNLAELDLDEGSADLAAAGLARSIAALDRAHARRAATELRCGLVEARLALGQVAEARALADETEGRARGHRDPVLLARALAMRGLVEIAEGAGRPGTLAEAEQLAGAVGAESEVGKAVAKLRAALR